MARALGMDRAAAVRHAIAKIERDMFAAQDVADGIGISNATPPMTRAAA